MSVIDRNKPLPDHTRLRYDECYAKLLLEHCFPALYSGLTIMDRPDLCDGSVCGIEVTSAVPIELQMARRNHNKAVHAVDEQHRRRYIENMEKSGQKYAGGVQPWTKVKCEKSEHDTLMAIISDKLDKLHTYHNFECYDLFVESEIWLEVQIDKYMNELTSLFFERSLCDGVQFRYVYVTTSCNNIVQFDISNCTYEIVSFDSVQFELSWQARNMVIQAEKSLLDELLVRHCYDGVEYKRLGDIVDFEQPTKYIVRSADYDDSFPTPVLTAGQSFILGYTDELTGHYVATKNDPVIIFDDFTGAFKWVDFEFKVKSSAMKMLKADEGQVMLRYVFHMMSHLNFMSSEHKRLWIGVYSNFEIPVPPLPVQPEIVRILDKFTQLTAELTAELIAELTARRKQYEFYRDRILSFDACDLTHQRAEGVFVHGSFTKLQKLLQEYCPDGGPYRSVQDVVGVNRGTRLTKSQLSDDGEYEVYHGSKDSILGRYNQYNAPANTTIVVNTGGIGGVKFLDKPFWCSDGSFWLGQSDDIDSKFLYYCLSGYEGYFYSQKRVGGVPTIDRCVVEDFQIPVPPLPVQREIVRILDKFTQLTVELTVELTAEIAARQKQYEYYRDKLLTFERKA